MYQNYITGQTTLSLNLDFSIPANHIASVISEFVDSIPNEVILETTSNTGRPAYHPAMMLKILLFAYSRRVFSGRKIERMLEENLPMMILADNRKISYHTINNFRSSDHANKVIKQCFVYFTSLLDEGLIRENAVFIDGTKIEADANKYTFVWKKAVEKYHAKLKEDVSALYDELINKEVVKAMAEEEVQTSQVLEILAQETEKEIEKISEEIFAGRNSYSKTDHDATFMHMKEDHMRNGQLKPGYNIQAATTNQYIVDFALFPNPTDFRTLEPFLEQMESRGILDKFQNIVADAGYGSEYNYTLLEEKYSDKNYQILYSLYDKEQTRKYKKDPTKIANWDYNEKDDYYIDKSGVRFNFKCYSQRKDRATGMVRNFKIYEADEFQLTEELTQLAKTKTGRQRQIHYNPNWQYLKEKAKETLQSEEGKRIYGCRKSDVEPIFGHMKSVFGMRRTHLRGKKKVETDVGIMFMTMNLKKYGANKKVKPSNFHFKNKKHRNSLKIMNCCVFISGLKI